MSFWRRSTWGVVLGVIGVSLVMKSMEEAFDGGVRSSSGSSTSFLKSDSGTREMVGVIMVLSLSLK